MRSDAKGHYATEAMIEIAQRLVAQLQDAGVTHVRDIALYYQPTDAKGLDIDVGTLVGPLDRLPLECGHLALTMPSSKIGVLRPGSASRRQQSSRRRRPGRDG